jgi:DNA-directed RNA polymerase specialized sigma24 family protein
MRQDAGLVGRSVNGCGAAATATSKCAAAVHTASLIARVLGCVGTMKRCSKLGVRRSMEPEPTTQEEAWDLVWDDVRRITAKKAIKCGLDPDNAIQYAAIEVLKLWPTWDSSRAPWRSFVMYAPSTAIRKARIDERSHGMWSYNLSGYLNRTGRHCPTVVGGDYDITQDAHGQSTFIRIGDPLLMKVLRKALDALPQYDREVVLKRIVHDHEPIDMAEHFNVPPASVRSKLCKTLSKLRDALGGSYEDFAPELG